MKTKLLLLLILLYSSCAYSQESRCYNTQTKALNVGVYDYSKVKKNTPKVLYDEEARKALETRIAGNQELIDFVGGWMSEQDVVSYYPQEDIALLECPVTSVAVFDLKNLKDGYGDPSTYTYSPSGKYRFSILEADGIHSYLEEKINGEYLLCEDVQIGGAVNSHYWEDDDTIHYLVKRTRYDTNTGKDREIWIGYSTKIYSTKCKE